MSESEEEKRRRHEREAFEDRRWKAMSDKMDEKKRQLAEEIIRKAQEKQIARDAIKKASDERKAAEAKRKAEEAAAKAAAGGTGCIVGLILLGEMLISIIGPHRWS